MKRGGMVGRVEREKQRHGPIETPYVHHILKVSAVAESQQKTIYDEKDLVLKRLMEEQKKSKQKWQMKQKIAKYKIIKNKVHRKNCNVKLV